MPKKKTVDREIKNYIKFWTTDSSKVIKKLTGSFDDDSVARKLKKLLKSIK